MIARLDPDAVADAVAFTSDANGLRINTQNNSGLSTTSYTWTGTGNATLNAATLNVANLYGGAGDDTLTGDANANWLAGGLRADTIKAGAGDDVVWKVAA